MTVRAVVAYEPTMTVQEAEAWLEQAAPETRAIISQAWAEALAAEGELAEDFYARVFAAEPALTALFPGDMSEQKQLLTRSITTALDLIDDVDALLLLLRASGARHAHYGVAERQFDVLGKALLETIAARAGPAFSGAHEQAWAAYYSAMSAVMRDGMRRAARA